MKTQHRDDQKLAYPPVRIRGARIALAVLSLVLGLFALAAFSPGLRISGRDAAMPSIHAGSPGVVAVRTPVPNSLYPYPEQRVGAVAFNTSELDIASLHAGLLKLEQRGPTARERDLGFDSVTVLLVGQGWCDPSDPADWEACSARITDLVADNPGHTWFVGNEPENPCRPGGMHSGEYARVYYAIYQLIKAQDASAQVGIGGVVIPSQARRDWLDRVLDSYRGSYGEPMPVDIWNVHNLLLSECPGSCGCRDPNPCPNLCCSGGYLPPEFGCDSSRRTYRPQDSQVNANEFKQLIREFRAWMATREAARDKPLIITEMGVLAPRRDSGGPYPVEWINEFMYETFDWMMNATDQETGYSADGYRLVQRWTWYSLTDRSFNGSLFDGRGQLTDFGLSFANYAARFLPASPTTIFFQRGWTGYSQDTDTWIAADGFGDTDFKLLISSDSTYKALLKFDVSLLPTDVEVVSATLSLRLVARSGVSAVTVNSYGIKRPWEVSDATWTQATDTTLWEVPGIGGESDREMEPTSSVLVDAPDTTYAWDVTDLARQWVADPDANYGVLLEGHATGTSTLTFISSDQVEQPPYNLHRLRPKLELVVRLAEPSQTPTASPTATGTLTATPTATEVVTATPTEERRTLYLPILVKGS